MIQSKAAKVRLSAKRSIEIGAARRIEKLFASSPSASCATLVFRKKVTIVVQIRKKIPARMRKAFRLR